VIAVFSDVHGNLPALQAVLADIDARGIDRLWCLGDTTGYGPFVNECMRVVAQRCEILLAGNHDLAVRGDLDAGVFGGAAGAGIAYARNVIATDTMDTLNGLSASRIHGTSAQLFHASARDPVWEYVTNPDVAASHLRSQKTQISLVGHSHRQLLYAIADDAMHGTPATGGAVAPDQVVQFDPSFRYVANPGSVGQPRDGDWRAGYAILADDAISFHRVPYDITPMRKAVAQVGLPSSIADCLERGSAP
jgi:predicted phosphodiesterase